jgi:PPOX class probable F420-dependent enzyme
MTDTRPLPPSTPAPLSIAEAAASRYLLLRTFRADGSGVDTPIWFAIDGPTLWFRTPTASPKVRRLGRRPRVELRLCTWQGTVRSAAALRGHAAIAEGDAARHGHQLLARRYGWQWNVVPMLRIPGVPSGHRDLGLRDRLAHMRARELWPGSSIIRVDLEEA